MMSKNIKLTAESIRSPLYGFTMLVAHVCVITDGGTETFAIISSVASAGVEDAVIIICLERNLWREKVKVDVSFFFLS